MPARLLEPLPRTRPRVHAKPERAMAARAENTLRFRCPACATPVRARLEAAGKRGRCPACRGALVFPQPGGAAPRKPAAAKAKAEPLPRRRTAWRLSAIFLLGLALGIAGGRWIGKPQPEAQIATRPRAATEAVPAKAEIPLQTSSLGTARLEEPEPRVTFPRDVEAAKNPFLKASALDPAREPEALPEPALVEPAAPVLARAGAGEGPDWSRASESPRPALAALLPNQSTPPQADETTRHSDHAPTVPEHERAAVKDDPKAPEADPPAAPLTDRAEAGREPATVPSPPQAGGSPIPLSEALPAAAPQTHDSKPAPEPKTIAQPEIQSAREIERKVIDRYRGEDSIQVLSLLLINDRGESRRHRLIRYRKKTGGLTKSLFCYLEPSDVKGTSTLTVEQEGEDDLQRLYLPALKKNRRIASADKGKSWSGTDWSYEDLRERKLDDYEYSALDTVVLHGHPCYHYTMKPVTPEKSSYGMVEYWVRKDIEELIKGRYYDKKGRCFKELAILGLKQVWDRAKQKKVWTPHHMEMKNLDENHRTVFVVEREVYNTGLPDEFFSVRSMTEVKLEFEGNAELIQVSPDTQ